MKRDAGLLFFICIASFQTTFAKLNVTVKPVIAGGTITLLEGQAFDAMCSVSVPLSSCGWYFNGSSEPIALEPNPGGNLMKGIFYSGQGLEYGECGITIRNVTEDHNKILICYLSPKNESYGKNETKSLNLVLAKAPRAPKIKIIRIDHMIKKNSPDTFVENQTIEVECTVKFGRPEANIRWYIGSEPIEYNLTELEIRDLEPEFNGQKIIFHTLKKKLNYSDNGKDLRCVAEHFALTPGTLENPTFKLKVHFSPKPGVIEPRGNTTGHPGEIIVTFQANPEPNTQWQVNGEEIFEGDMYGTDLKSTGEASWQAVLKIREIRAEDVEKNYTLIASNKFGQAEYEAKISAYPCSDVKNSTFSSDIPVSPTCPTCVTWSDSPEPSSDQKGCPTCSECVTSPASSSPKACPTPSSDQKDCPACPKCVTSPNSNSATPSSDQNDCPTCSECITSPTSSSPTSPACPTCPFDLSDCPTWPDCPTPSPDPKPCPTSSLDFKPCPTSSPDPIPCPKPSVDVTAWSVAGTAVVILFIILIRPIMRKFISNRRWRSAAPVPTVRYKLRKDVRDAEEDKFY